MKVKTYIWYGEREPDFENPDFTETADYMGKDEDDVERQVHERAKEILNSLKEEGKIPDGCRICFGKLD